MSRSLVRGLVCSNVLLAALFAAGCGASEGAAEDGVVSGDDLIDEAVGSREQELLQPSSWGTSPSHDIDVCFRSKEFRSSGLATFRKNVRTWVDQQIGRVSDLRFHGWGECPPPGAPRYIQVQVDTDFWGSGGGFQDGCDGCSGFMDSGPTQIQYGRNGVLSSRQGERGVVLHEFMHALGFAHEFNREENQTNHDCDWKGVQRGDTFGTPYDHDSILNRGYCDGPSNVLSAWDVVGLQRMYGFKHYLSIVGVSNKCLDIDNPSMSPPMASTRVQAWECLNNVNQLWYPGAASDSASWTPLSLSHGLSGGTHVIMHVNGGTTNGTPVVNSTFTNAPQQQWRLDGMEIVGMGDMCLDSPVLAGGVPLLKRCNGSSNQKWDIFRNTSGNNGTYIRFTAAPNLCLTRNGASGLALRSCDFASNPQPESQRWGFGTGHISQDSSSCLDVLWATPSQGQTVQVIPCRATDGSDQLNDAQRWYFRGPIHGLGGKCLDVNAPSGPNIENGAKVGIWDCHGGENQKFDYHF